MRLSHSIFWRAAHSPRKYEHEHQVFLFTAGIIGGNIGKPIMKGLKEVDDEFAGPRNENGKRGGTVTAGGGRTGIGAGAALVEDIEAEDEVFARAAAAAAAAAALNCAI